MCKLGWFMYLTETVISPIPNPHHVKVSPQGLSSIYVSLHCDLDLESSKPIFSHDTPAHDEHRRPYEVWLQKGMRFRRYDPDEHILNVWTFAVTFTLNTTIQSLHPYEVRLQKYLRFRRHDPGRTWTEILNLHCNIDLEHSNPTFSQDTPTQLMVIHHQTSSVAEGISSSEDTSWNTDFNCRSPLRVFDLEDSKLIFSHETLAHDDAP